MNKKEIKEEVLKLGADLVGVASTERFSNAPEGFKPSDIYSDTKSVIVYGKRTPMTSMYAVSPVPYTLANSIMGGIVDHLSLELSLLLEDKGIGAVMVPSDDPYEHWDAHRCYGRAILSLRHAGWLAGLGFLGRSNLLINGKYGNIIQLGAMLIDKKLEPDTIIEGECPDNCRLCIDNCPPHALDGKTVNQRLCRPLSNTRNLKGFVIKKCNICRSICPLATGAN